MKKTIIVLLIIVAVFGGLGLAMKARAPQKPPLTIKENWDENGIPVEMEAVIRGDMEQTVEVTGNIKALDEMTLSAKVSGRVAAVYAREGDAVSPGMTVIMLDQDDAQSNLRSALAGLETAQSRLSQARTNAKVTKIQTDSAIEQAQASLDAAKAKLAVVKVPSRSQDKMVAENKVAAAKANLDNKEADYKRNKKLVDKGAISQSTYEVVETQYKIAQTDYKSATEQLSLIKEGGRDEDVQAAKSQVSVAQEQLRAAKANASQNMLRQEDIKSAIAGVRQAEAAVALAKQQVSYTYVKSPIAGQMASRSTEPGQVVSPGQALGSVVNLGSLYYEGDISEVEMVNVMKGQPVKVRIDAIPGKTFEGQVVEIYPAASTQSRNFPVRIKILDKTGSIRPGMFARGNIITGLDKNVVLLPKDSVYENKGSTMVFSVGADKKAKRYDVEILRENRNYVELTKPIGLNPGDMVVTSGRQNLQPGSKVMVRNGK